MTEKQQPNTNTDEITSIEAALWDYLAEPRKVLKDAINRGIPYDGDYETALKALDRYDQLATEAVNRAIRERDGAFSLYDKLLDAINNPYDAGSANPDVAAALARFKIAAERYLQDRYETHLERGIEIQMSYTVSAMMALAGVDEDTATEMMGAIDQFDHPAREPLSPAARDGFKVLIDTLLDGEG